MANFSFTPREVYKLTLFENALLRIYLPYRVEERIANKHMGVLLSFIEIWSLTRRILQPVVLYNL